MTRGDLLRVDSVSDGSSGDVLGWHQLDNPKLCEMWLKSRETKVEWAKCLARLEAEGGVVRVSE